MRVDIHTPPDDIVIVGLKSNTAYWETSFQTSTLHAMDTYFYPASIFNDSHT